jgi:hypothetical protein
MIAHIRELVDTGKLEEEAVRLSPEEEQEILEIISKKETRQ